MYVLKDRCEQSYVLCAFNIQLFCFLVHIYDNNRRFYLQLSVYDLSSPYIYRKTSVLRKRDVLRSNTTTDKYIGCSILTYKCKLLTFCNFFYRNITIYTIFWVEISLYTNLYQIPKHKIICSIILSMLFVISSDFFSNTQRFFMIYGT